MALALVSASPPGASPAVGAAYPQARRTEGLTRRRPAGAAAAAGTGGRNYRQNADDLLYELFPPKVARALAAGKPVEPERYECVSIFFSDIVGYTDLCSQLAPHEVMDLLHRLYSCFDDMVPEHELFKVETIGDAYMAVSNLRWPQPTTHARLLAEFAFNAVRVASLVPVHPSRPELGCVRIRVGLHSGPVVASVVGTLNRRYCLFGDTVNTASRMESNSEAGRVHCSAAFAGLLRDQCPGAELASRGVLNVKGKGPMETFWVNAMPGQFASSGLSVIPVVIQQPRTLGAAATPRISPTSL